MMMEASHLSVVLDLSPTQWNLSTNHSQPLPLNSFLAQLLAFLNAHIAAKHENTLAVFAAFPGKRHVSWQPRFGIPLILLAYSICLYSSTDPLPKSLPLDSNSYPPFKLVDSTIVTRIMEEFDDLGDPSEEAPSSLVGALTKALCYVNRITLPSTSSASKHNEGLDPSILPDPRVLVLSVSPDLSTSYIPIMNAIFSAQKLASIPLFFNSRHRLIISSS
ncbi:hypothetical protein H0H93_008422 [Arthromyces matolae]|nr:hypothetical protein H0H93_008422 [Arthromyces matolae]